MESYLKNPNMKSLSQVRGELLGVTLSANRQNGRVANKMLHQLDSQGKEQAVAAYWPGVR